MNNHPNSRQNLSTAAKDFNTALRWGNYKQAAQWLAPSHQQQFWTECDQIQAEVRLTGYQIRHISWKDTGSSQITVYYTYYYSYDPSLRHKILQQQWHYVPRLGKWEITQTALTQLMPH